ncbi:DNA internalization-related competence protein ComEC/Rec2 [Lactobacillus pentosus] [Lactiplantibacillus mudanjiangensis]|uniref:DNA internalization-related competence protein ComEC/Rec2 n=1 Tax=Lactiplantibacillus mudanjiangensis TaxID=1296538 RepID=UPI0010142846|nr:DNA internalization-related competence protein ComEC/Rec2 [Lactiplantibacillus mudanjiangensis]VDG30599.1 DNA internalization-related competence protein ComEC/Rec2 [Lactobacillus pentosus] [Lactiplantibacillus mudanjiangensis]
MSRGFFAAISCGLLSSWLIGQQWLAAGLLCLWLLRVWLLSDRLTWYLVFGLTLVMAGWLSWQQWQFQQVTRTVPIRTAMTMTVQPDEINVKGSQYQLVGHSEQGRVIGYGRLQSAIEKQQLATLTHRTRWQVQGELSPVPPPTNPGQFDAPAYYRSQGIQRQVMISSVTKLQLAPRHGWGWLIDWLHHQRQQFIVTMNQLPATLRLYAISLLVGGRPNEFRTEMTAVQQLGLLHLFSLSGMHVILLMGMLKWVLIRAHLSQMAINYWLLGLLPLYLVLGGGADSLQRAVLTAWLPLLWQWLTGRRSLTLTGWSVALMVGITLNPLVLLSLGGQLSYGLALLLILVPAMPTWRLSLWVQLIGLPVILVATAQWHLLTIVVNLAIGHIFSWILLPLTMLGAAVGPFLPAVAQFCDWGLAHFQAGLNWVGQLPGLMTVGQPPAWLAWSLALITLWLLKQPTTWLWRSLILGYTGLILGRRWPLQGAVQFIDIGQGDSILIREPFNRTVSLIDTGGRLHLPTPAWAADNQPRPRVATITVNYLHRLGISQIDTVYLSHKDVDHIGDFGDLLTLIRVKQVVVPAGMAALPKFQKLLQATSRPVKVVEALAGQQFPAGLTAIHPFQPGAAENGDSLVLTGHFGQHQFMFTGDLDRAGERAIGKRYPDLKADVLKLGHHGSKTSSDPQMLKQWGVQRGIISAGRHNRYGHPNLETLQTLQQQGILNYSTALQGMISYHYGWGTAGYWETFLKEGNFYQRAASDAGTASR